MIKAVFCDFYGTLVPEYGPASYEVVKRVYKSGKVSSPEAVVAGWWELYSKKQAEAYGDHYRSQYDLALESFAELLPRFSSNEDPRSLCDKMTEHWSYPELYEDSRDFLEQCGLPVWLVTNSDTCYVETAVKHCGIAPAGIVTSESARHPKPRPEIYRCALEQAGLSPEEVVHIGDSLRGDVQGPAAVGIRAIWLNREGKPVPEGVEAVKDLRQALERIRQL